MPAAATDLLQKVGGAPGTATTLSAPGYTIGNTSINVGSTSNWSTDTGITFCIDTVSIVNGVEVRDAGSYNEYVGTATSGTQITNVSWVAGSGDRNYSAGATTRVYVGVSANRENRLVTWGTTEHNQNGTHSNITATTLSVSSHIDVNDSSTAIRDSSDNELVKFAKTALAVNEVTVTNAATGNGPTVSATGGDTNIDLNFVTKGTGKLKLNGNTIGAINGTDANGWTQYTNAWGKKVYVKKVSQAVSLGTGIAFQNYSITSTPVDVGANLANYYCSFGVLMPTGSRQVSTSIMYSGSNIELGAINHFTGGTWSGTAIVSLMITEA